MENLKEDIIARSMLSRLDPPRRFYMNTDWYKDGIGAAILQADGSAEEINI